MPEPGDSTDKTNIEKELQSARKKLLDLTMRNKLLNFRPAQARSLKIIGEDPAGIYNILVLQEKSMQFRGKTPNLFQEASADPQSEETRNPEAETDLWVLPANNEPKESEKDTILQTTLEPETLQKRLFYIFQDSRSILEELGYSTLYLATTFLEWTEFTPSRDRHLAPLILIPVDLERSGVRSAFRVKWNGEDITTNISLQEILRQQEIKLPDFEMPETPEGLNSYLQQVVSAVQSHPDWRVINETHLGFFSFTKFIMYKDIDPAAWPEGRSPAEHPLIKAIYGSTGSQVSDTGIQENEIDQKLRPIDLFHVMDADSSQIAVIEDVKAGRNLAVEGPPGTGKSQTIVNIVAELLAAGKSVLFVSEKMAALEVVKSRLDAVGLGDFCLELHSRKTNKKEFLANLERTLYTTIPGPVPAETEYDELESLKLLLNKYAENLWKPFGNTRLSPFELYHQKEQALDYFESRQKPLPRVKLENLKEIDKSSIEAAKQKLRELQGVLPLVYPVTQHPWFGCAPGIILPASEEAILEQLTRCLEEIKKLQIDIDNIAAFSAVKSPAAIGELPDVLAASGIMAESGPIDRAVLENYEWNKPNHHAENLIAKLKELRGTREQVLKKFKDEVLNQDTAPLLEQFRILSASVFKIFKAEYRQIKQKIRLMYRSQPPGQDIRIVADLEQLGQYAHLLNVIKGYKHAGMVLFGPLWKEEESDPDVLDSFSRWIVSFRQYLVKKIFTEKAIDLVVNGVSGEEIEKARVKLKQDQESVERLLEGLAVQTGADYTTVFGHKLIETPITEIVSQLELWKSETSKLLDWSQYVAIHNQCQATIAAPLIPLIEKDLLEAGDILPCFEANLADDLLTAVFWERPTLANFTGHLHENKIKRFVELDRKLIMLNRQRLVEKLLRNRPSLFEGASPGSEIGILRSEFNRKRGHMPIRKLMAQAGGLIQKIKPCFMMSPLSIAQFLDPRTTRFDVIIYDEASQVRPEDALGALLRGNQAVVIGDTRQLPPTTFFDRLIEDGTEEDTETSIHIETESILHLCRRCFPVKMLRWHYRSKHESLVAVSNREFYNNRLLLYPSPIQESEELGLHLVHLPGTIYDRGAGQTNRQEARIVAEKALEHFRRYPDKSLGIGAFNIKQQQAILEEIEKQIRQHPDMEAHFSGDRPEHFFVKNLETIQGDERDVIFISTGYGFDKNGKMTLNFGPLNNDGGERRLNVLITRAREKCVVFANFKADDLHLDSTASEGLKALKLFLDYAENHQLDNESPDEKTQTTFEDSVYRFLRTKGYDVKKRVGCAGFRVDLAISDANSQDAYLLGIECDGPKYHTSAVARDRDRLRQQILERLGWQIYRVWSTDWYRNRKESQRRLLEAIEKRMSSQAAISNPDTPAVEAAQLPLTIPLDGKQPESQIIEGRLNPLDSVAKYQTSENFLKPVPQKEIQEMEREELARIITRIVEVESPVHFEEVVRRIRDFWGLNRTNNKIHDAISEAAALAVDKQWIKENKEFLWSVKTASVRVRRREGNPPARLELICDEEIMAAIELVLKSQHATLPDDLSLRTSRLLGIKATSDKTSGRITDIINRMIGENKLQKQPNGMINFLET